jgi:hypothetical protein
VRPGVIHLQSAGEVATEDGDFKIGNFEAAGPCLVIAARGDFAIVKP